MNRIAIRIFKWLVQQAVVQGYNHKDNIACMYQIIRDAVENEFTEDNAPTIDRFLLEQFNRTQKRLVGKVTSRNELEEACHSCVINQIMDGTCGVCGKKVVDSQE